MAKRNKTGSKAQKNYKKLASAKRLAVRNERMKTENAMVAGKSGQGGTQDRGAGQRITNISSHPLDRTRSAYARAQEWANLYWKEWTAKKIVQIPVDDMLRNGWEYKNLDEDRVAIMGEALLRIRFGRKLRNALRLERLLGGAVMLLGLRDKADTPKEPLDLDSIETGDLQFVNVIPRTRLSHAIYDNNPFSPTFGSPTTFNIYGKEVHISRLLVFNGDPLTENPKDDFTYKTGNRDGMGESVLSPVYDDIIRSIGTRQAGYHLIQRASVLIINNQNMQAQLESKDGKAALEKLDEIADQIDIYQAAMIDGKKVEIDQWNASFGSVPELIMQYLQIISAGSDIPATRFLGQAPGGLNATGTSDLENYYNMIDARRETDLRENLEKFFHIMMRSQFGKDFTPDMVELEFPPLWNLSESELGTIRSQDSTNIISAFSSGMIDATFANKEMKDREIWKSDPEGDDLPEMDMELDSTAGRSSADLLKALKGTKALPGRAPKADGPLSDSGSGGAEE